MSLGTIALGGFILIFALVGFFFVGKMIHEGKIGIGGRGGPADEFVRRGEDPLRFWKILATVFILSLILFLAAVLLFSGLMVLPG